MYEDVIRYNKHTLKYPKHPQTKTSQYGNGKNYIWSPNPNGAKPKDVFLLCLLKTLKTCTHETGHMFMIIYEIT